MSYKAEKDPDPDSYYYWGSIPELYTQKSDKLIAEFGEYVEQVSKADFSRLAQLRNSVS